jgi:diazepam-binding inhibitor (GABA receptor modulator, acyl-CoA-binding protein)
MDPTIEQSFYLATQKVAKYYDSIDNDTLLKLYGLYKQGTIGLNTNPQPERISLRALAKWNSWNNEKNKSKITAMKEYIDLVKILIL